MSSRTPSLPVLARRADATRACSFCPKLCRPACPVSTVTANDAVSAWGIMNALHVVTRGDAPLDASSAEPAYACSGCGACQSHCELAVNVPDTALDARAEALRSNVAPESISTFVSELPRREARVRAEAERVGAAESSPSGVVIFAGCTLVSTAISQVIAAQRAVESLVGPVTVVGDLCCGAPWLDAGDLDGFRARAEAVGDRLRRATTVIALDPGCAHAMTVRAPSRGVRSRPMKTLEQYFLERIDRVPEGALASMGSFAVHDSCRSGRGLRAFDAPRAVLQRLTGRAPTELVYHREHATCSGGGGLLPVTNPAIADAITDELAAQVRDAGVDHVLAGCPTSRARLARVGISAFTLADLFCELGRSKA